MSGKGYYFGTLKTKSSNRYILIDDFLCNELLRWQAQQAENEKRVGDSYVYIYREENGHLQRQPKSFPAPSAEKVSLVCTQNDGRLIISSRFMTLLKREGLNAHSFRHTHTTQLIENGASAKGVAGRLGHASTIITQDLYTHNTQKLQEETVAVFVENLQTK